MKGSAFLKAFPVPRYLRFPAVGFDVSDGSVKFVELHTTSSGVEVGKFGKQMYSENDLMGALSEIRKKNNFDMVNVSIPEEEAFFVRIRLPFIKSGEIREAIELHIEEYIPYEAPDVEFDYEIMGTDPRPDGYVDVNVSVLPKVIVQKYLGIFESAGFHPTLFMVEAEATARSLIASNDKDVVMVVNIGKQNTVLSIVVRGLVWFSYTLKYGGDFLTERLVKACSVSADEAEKIKNEKGLTNSVDNQEVFDCLLPSVSSIRDEISKHYLYWANHRQESFMAQNEGEIKKIVLCGSQVNIPGLVDYIATATGVSTELGDPWINILDVNKYIPPVSRRDAVEYATAIGLSYVSIK
ncbi:MAG: pilus assembly protein PilM [Candidatus Vogelbacteria bacterium]|nr:pilus assembly protein PilM [Candidatus Vogelbacteria bacterium]